MEYSQDLGNLDISDLMYVKQLPNEKVHHYWASFLLVENRMAPCCDKEIIKAFQFNCKDEGLLNALAIAEFKATPNYQTWYTSIAPWRTRGGCNI